MASFLVTSTTLSPFINVSRNLPNGGNFMLKEIKETDLFCEYYAKWITVYKKGAIRKVTMDKYLMTQKWLVKLIPSLKVYEMNRIAYQQLLNDYAEYCCLQAYLLLV